MDESGTHTPLTAALPLFHSVSCPNRPLFNDFDERKRKSPETLRHSVTCTLEGELHAVRDDPGRKTVKLAREALAKQILIDFLGLHVASAARGAGNP